ncbi:MAG: hypothetical protein H7Y07_13410 [Pyrinomonadaceae bacterium]|nr:hypothetical protein [Sphingobacteriaceae bacterium]
MVEVFRTNVKDPQHADILLSKIHQLCTEYNANFDLEDCDKVLRVQCISGSIEPSLLINLINKCGFKAEVLPDSIPEY